MPRDKCPHCGSVELLTEVMSQGVHYAKLSCNSCRRFIEWLPKPENKNKIRREKSNTELVAEHGRGYCELCGILQKRIPKGEALEAHHVIEYQQGGDRERENIWIICTRCHKLIHWERTYIHHLIPGEYYAVDEDTASAEGAKPMDSLEDDKPPW
jgi:5-methylcytosine-specific restriction endonuclease McrA